MRRLRDPLDRPRRGAADVLRTLRASAPRPGVGGDRRLERRPADRPPRDGARRARLRRGEAAGAARRRRDRPRPLLDHRLEPVVERAAARPARPGPHRRARPQRQPDELGRAARGARGGADRARHDLRHRGDRGVDRARRLAAPTGRRTSDGPTRRRLLGRPALRGEARRLPRSARDPAARAWPAGERPGWRRLGARLRDLRARPDRRPLRARGAPGRGGHDRGGRARVAAGAARGPPGALHLRARLFRPPRLHARGLRGARRSPPDGRAARAPRRPSRQTS